MGASLEGMIIGIIGPALFALTLNNSTRKKQRFHIGIYLFIAGLGGALGSLFFGPSFNLLNQFHFNLLGIDWNGYRLFFVVSMLVNLLNLGLIKFMVPPDSFAADLVNARPNLLRSFAYYSTNLFKQNILNIKKTTQYILLIVFRRKQIRSMEEE